MPENLNEREDRGEASRERPNRGSEASPVSDREVPLSPVAGSDVINRWLDGELPEPTNLRGDAAKSVEFWRRLGEETERRRHMTTPSYVTANIMAALPAEPTTTVAPWYRKTLQLSPMTVIAAAAGIFALGVLVANAMVIR